VKEPSDIAKSIFNLICIIIGLSIFVPLGILSYQTYWYLRIGEWHSFSVITGLRWLNIQWAFYPNDWIGIYKILDEFPLWVGVFLCGAMLLVLMSLLIIAHEKCMNQK